MWLGVFSEARSGSSWLFVALESSDKKLEHSPGSIEEDEPPTVHVLLPTAVEEPASSHTSTIRNAWSSQCWILQVCSTVPAEALLESQSSARWPGRGTVRTGIGEMLKAKLLSLPESAKSLFNIAEFHRHAGVGVHPRETSQSGKERCTSSAPCRCVNSSTSCRMTASIVSEFLSRPPPT